VISAATARAKIHAATDARIFCLSLEHTQKRNAECT
jgi:hypothetical protein